MHPVVPRCTPAGVMDRMYQWKRLKTVFTCERSSQLSLGGKLVGVARNGIPVTVVAEFGEWYRGRRERQVETEFGNEKRTHSRLSGRLVLPFKSQISVKKSSRKHLRVGKKGGNIIFFEFSPFAATLEHVGHHFQLVLFIVCQVFLDFNKEADFPGILVP